MAVNLSDATQARLPAAIQRGHYDRRAVQAGIVHLGIGNFHRAHQAVYIDDILNSGDLRWGIVGASLKRPDMRDMLKPQDYLYMLGVRSDEDTRWRLIRSIQSVLYAPEDPKILINAIASPSTRIVSLTITEKAYCLDSKTGLLDETDPVVRHDLVNPHNPASAIGYIIASLKARIDARLPLPTILSCDNLSANGEKLRNSLIQFAELSDRQLAKTLKDELVCPSTMVDRIVPQTHDEDRREAALAIGMNDCSPVMTEPFMQWVVEDRFPLGRPEWEQFGVQSVSDVRPYERLKLGLLNGSHTTLAILGLLLGHRTVSDAVDDPVLLQFISDFMRIEVVPALLQPAGMDLEIYITSLLNRFKNPALHHRLLQIASDSSQKIPQRFLPVIQTRLERGLPLGRFAYAIAGFLLLVEAQGDDLSERTFQDPQRDAIRASLLALHDDIAKLLTLLENRNLFGPLKDHAQACSEVHQALSDFRRIGIRATLQQIASQ